MVSVLNVSWIFISIIFLIEIIQSQSTGLNLKNHKNWPKEQQYCGISSTSRIVGGVNAQLGQFPWIAQVGQIILRKEYYTCGGALISKRYVLTAAHCASSSNMCIKVGEYDTSRTPDCHNGICADEPQVIRVSKKIVHEHYNGISLENDIALLQLERPAKLSKWVKPICLPYGHIINLSLLNDIYTAAGWGTADNKTNPTVLQTVDIPIVENHGCEKSFKIRINKKQLCGGGVFGKDTCDGDSGSTIGRVLSTERGPRFFALGIVSAGDLNCGSKVPAIYTNVRMYVKWMLNNMS